MTTPLTKKLAVYTGENFTVEGNDVGVATVIEFKDAQAFSDVCNDFAIANNYPEFIFNGEENVPNPITKEEFYLRKLTDFLRITAETSARQQAALVAVQQYPALPGRE